MNYKRKAVLGTVGMAIIASMGSFCFMGVVLVQEELCQLRGFSTVAFSFFFTLYCAGSIVAGILIPKAIARLGFKRTVAIGTLGPAIGYVLLAVTPNIVLVYLAGFLMSFLFNFASFIPNGIFVSSWFRRGQGKMMSISTIVMSAVGIVGTPVAAMFVSQVHAIAACYGFAAVITGVSLVSALALVCGLPSEYGTGQVDVGKADDAEEKASQAGIDVYDPQMPIKRLAFVPPVLACLVAPVVLSVALTAYSTYSISMLQSFGLEYVQASICMSIGSVATILFVSAFGVLSDKFGPKVVMIGYTAVSAVMVLVSSFLTGWAGALVLGVFVYLVNYTNMYAGLVMPLLVGPRRAPEFMGLCGSIMGFAGMFAAPIAASVYAATDSYTGVIVLIAALDAVFIPLIAFGMSKRGQEDIRKSDEPYAAKAADAAKAVEGLAEQG